MFNSKRNRIVKREGRVTRESHQMVERMPSESRDMGRGLLKIAQNEVNRMRRGR